MSKPTPSTEGLMALVQTYADQEVQCVARSEDEAYWGLFRERERIGDGIRAYLEAMVQNAYAEGREDERAALQEVGWVLVESANNEYGRTAKPYLGTELLDLPLGRHTIYIAGSVS